MGIYKIASKRANNVDSPGCYGWHLMQWLWAVATHGGTPGTN